MEPDFQSVTPKVEDSGTHITGLMADHQPPHNAVPQGPSDGEHMFLSNTSMQPATPPVSQLETTPIMPDESLIPCRTPSDSLPEPPQNAPASDACQPAIISDVHSVAQQACASPSQDPAKYSVAPMDSGSDENAHSTRSIYECGSPFMDLSAPSVPSPCPLLVPLPESDVEEDHSSESLQDEDVASTAGSSSQNSDAYTISTGGRTSPSSGPEPQDVRPSAADDHMALWVLGDTVLERHDRRVYERWKAGLGVTFVLANVLSVIILCIALELYRRMKAAHPTLVSKIRARHRVRTGRDSPFSPIVSLFFEEDAPFLNSNTAFLTGLCTTLICTLLSDMALRWIARSEDRQPLPTATPRERMVARMEWNERMERYAVPWVLEIGIPGLLYVALFFFFSGAFIRAFPFLNTAVCWAFGVLCMVLSIRALWSFEPALDARLRPKPFSSSTRH